MKLAGELGKQIALQGWVLLTGGRHAGVMHAANSGAKQVQGSLTVGVLPSAAGNGVSPDVDVAIFTGIGEARNVVNVLSSDVVVACGGGGPGTASEAALALKAGKPLILLTPPKVAAEFFLSLGKPVEIAETPNQVIAFIKARHPGR